ncbi:MAG: UDP-glucose 4-epimerase GalE [Termitinemataceae bacterium]|nr:MAG: UDP-glucose 4-epimerase GalE [Termitinemataceae bacterium]
MKTVLVVGGLGYIGSHVVQDLTEHNYNVVVLDDLSEGHRESLNNSNVDFICANINDTGALENVFTKYSIDVVMHFSAFAYVGESVDNPQKYYLNNVCATINLLSAMLRHNVKKFIFSSSCATYGVPEYTPIDEAHPQNPINPYGATKLMVERILNDYHHAYDFDYCALRYFNAAGADPSGKIGESHRIETHLIPLVLKTLTGEKQNISIFGDDYETPDGTCIRDYIHVCDLSLAHRLAMELILDNGGSYCVNLGTGMRTSVKDIIKACEDITGRTVPVVVSRRRCGDPAVLVASTDYAKKLLGWSASYTNIHDIIKTAWNWEQNKKY